MLKIILNNCLPETIKILKRFEKDCKAATTAAGVLDGDESRKAMRLHESI